MQPTPHELWMQAAGDPERYRELMRQHGYILEPDSPGYEQAIVVVLPCGWPHPAT